MRILHLAPRLSDRGGADRHLLGLLEALHPHHLNMLAVGQVDSTVKTVCAVRVLEGLDAREACRVALESTASFSPDLIHLHNIVNPAVLEWAASRPAILTVQDHRFFCPGRGKWTRQGEVCRRPMSGQNCAGCFDDDSYYLQIFNLTKKRLKAASAIALLVLSGYMRTELMAMGIPESRISVIPPFVSGLDSNALKGSSGADYVLFAGRLVEAKGVQDAVAAWRRSEIKKPLVFAGTGPLRSQLERQGLDVRGWMSHRRLSKMYQDAGVVIMPSRWQEPFGIVGLEALFSGVPVAAYRSGGVEEWHPGKGLVQWGDIDGLAHALRDLWGESARISGKFDRALLMNKLIHTYLTVIG